MGSATQQRMLRRLFWLRCWSSTSINSFRVSSALNPADPLSRENQGKMLHSNQELLTVPN